MIPRIRRERNGIALWCVGVYDPLSEEGGSACAKHVLLLADAYINKKKEAKAKKKKKHRRMFIDFLRIGHWQKEKIPRDCFCGVDANSSTHKKKENDWEFRNCLVARTTSS